MEGAAAGVLVEAQRVVPEGCAGMLEAFLSSHEDIEQVLVASSYLGSPHFTLHLTVTRSKLTCTTSVLIFVRQRSGAGLLFGCLWRRKSHFFFFRISAEVLFSADVGSRQPRRISAANADRCVAFFVFVSQGCNPSSPLGWLGCRMHWAFDRPMPATIEILNARKTRGSISSQKCPMCFTLRGRLMHVGSPID